MYRFARSDADVAGEERRPRHFARSDKSRPADATFILLNPQSAIPSVRQLLHVDVLEPQVGAVVLQLDGALVGDALVAVEVVFQRHIIDDQLAVEPDTGLVVLHDDAEAVPLADLLVHDLERLESSLLVVPEGAGAFR